MPLRVLVTTALAAPLAQHLAGQGLHPVHVPLIEAVPTGEAAPDGAPAGVLVTSARTPRMAPDLAARVGAARVVAVGERTRQALVAAGVPVAATGTSGGAAAVALVDDLLPAGARLWHVGARAPSRQLADALAGLERPVSRWRVYQTQVPSGARAALAAVGPVDVVTFASGSAARAFAALWPGPPPRVAVLGPSTHEDAEAAGLAVHAVARSRQLEGLAEAAARAGRSLSAPSRG